METHRMRECRMSGWRYLPALFILAGPLILEGWKKHRINSPAHAVDTFHNRYVLRSAIEAVIMRVFQAENLCCARYYSFSGCLR